jgi:hypothetical protein
MTELQTTSGLAPLTRRLAGLGTWLAAWLLARPRGRWATRRGRWAQTILTITLLLTGLLAWGLALVQPWTNHMSPGSQVLASLDAERVRAAGTDLESLSADDGRPKPTAPRRNPFVMISAEGAAALPLATPAVAAVTAPSEVPQHAAPPPTKPLSAKDILEAVKSLRLEITVMATTGQRWAVINGQEYREGESVAGFQVLEIQEGKVKLQQAETTCLLRME